MQRCCNHLLGLQNLSAATVRGLLKEAHRCSDLLDKTDIRPAQLNYRWVGMLCWPPISSEAQGVLSTPSDRRITSTFISAAKRLGLPATTAVPDPSEAVSDVVRSVVGISDQPKGKTRGVILIRHTNPGIPRDVAQLKSIRGSRVSVINAGQRAGEHPTEALVYLSVISKTLGDPKHLSFLFVGDAKFNSVGRSLIFALSKLGSTTCLLTTSEFDPHDSLPVKVVKHFTQVTKTPDVIISLPVEGPLSPEKEDRVAFHSLYLTQGSLHTLLSQRKRPVTVVPCMPTLPPYEEDPGRFLDEEPIEARIIRPSNFDSIAARMAALKYSLSM
jgi:aspartate carbamoyltransferase catalytic subunit